MARQQIGPVPTCCYRMYTVGLSNQGYASLLSVVFWQLTKTTPDVTKRDAHWDDNVMACVVRPIPIKELFYIYIPSKPISSRNRVLTLTTLVLSHVFWLSSSCAQYNWVTSERTAPPRTPDSGISTRSGLFCPDVLRPFFTCGKRWKLLAAYLL